LHILVELTALLTRNPHRSTAGYLASALLSLAACCCQPPQAPPSSISEEERAFAQCRTNLQGDWQAAGVNAHFDGTALLTLDLGKSPTLLIVSILVCDQERILALAEGVQVEVQREGADVLLLSAPGYPRVRATRRALPSAAPP
jgi:hypothetical protein